MITHFSLTDSIRECQKVLQVIRAPGPLSREGQCTGLCRQARARGRADEKPDALQLSLHVVTWWY